MAADYVRVDPAALDAEGDRLEVGEQMGHKGVLAVRRNAHSAQASGTAGKLYGGRLQRAGVDEREHRRDFALERLRGPRQRQVVGHDHRAAVGSDRRGNRLAHGPNAGYLPAGRQIDDRNVVVEPVANVEPLAVGGNRRTGCRVAGRDQGDQLARPGRQARPPCFSATPRSRSAWSRRA